MDGPARYSGVITGLDPVIHADRGI